MLDIVADLVGTFFSNNDRILSRSSFYDVYMKCAESDSLMDATMGSLGTCFELMNGHVLFILLFCEHVTYDFFICMTYILSAMNLSE
jgi:hypothetical protein